MKNVNKFIQKLSDFGDQVALIFSEKIITYSVLVNEINLSKHKILNLNIKQGEIVFILGDYSLESISLFFSLSMNGNIIVPITSLNEEEINERIEVAKPNLAGQKSGYYYWKTSDKGVYDPGNTEVLRDELKKSIKG